MIRDSTIPYFDNQSVNDLEEQMDFKLWFCSVFFVHIICSKDCSVNILT